MSERRVSHPLDVFVANDIDKQILDIFIKHVAKVSPRKRKAATEFAINLLRSDVPPTFSNTLGRSLLLIEKYDTTEN